VSFDTSLAQPVFVVGTPFELDIETATITTDDTEVSPLGELHLLEQNAEASEISRVNWFDNSECV